MSTDTNANLAAALAGIAIAAQDNSNDDTANNSFNDTNTEVETEVEVKDSFQDNSDNSDNSDSSQFSHNDTDVDVGVQDSFNTDNSLNLQSEIDVELEDSLNTTTGSFNDDHSETSTNSHNSADTNVDVDVALEDSLNNSSTNGSFNGVNTALDVEIEDSLNNNSTSSVQTDSSQHFDLEVEIEDAFNTSDSDWLDLDGLNFDVMQTVGNALNGSGNDNAFSLAQVSEMNDSDSLTATSGSSSGVIGQLAFQEGGISDGMDGHGIANDAGEGSEVAGSATSAADAHLEALNQNISMGANIQYNTMNISVVGGEGLLDDA